MLARPVDFDDLVDASRKCGLVPELYSKPCVDRLARFAEAVGAVVDLDAKTGSSAG